MDIMLLFVLIVSCLSLLSSVALLVVLGVILKKALPLLKMFT